jgi:hypothetical protein
MMNDGGWVKVKWFEFEHGQVSLYPAAVLWAGLGLLVIAFVIGDG